MIFDTGSAYTAIAQGTSIELGLPPSGERSVYYGGKETLFPTFSVILNLGNRIFVQCPVVLEMPIPGADVLVGMDVLQEFTLVVDGPKRTITLSENSAGDDKE